MGVKMVELDLVIVESVHNDGGDKNVNEEENR